jgi:ABC-2 type transport system permease protein
LRSFSNLMVNEWLKLSKKRTFIVPYMILILITLLIGYILHSVSLDMFGSAYDFSSVMLHSQGLGQVITILAIIGTAGIVSKEYSQGTIKFLLIRARSRTAILASKYVVVLMYAFTLSVIDMIAVFASGALWFGLNGGEAGIIEMLTSLMYSFVITVVYATLAFMIGILTTSTGVTIGITMFMLMMDKLIITRDFYKYVLFPNLNLAAYEGGGAPMPGMTLTFSIMMLVLYTVVFLLIGFSVFRRRDVA